MNTKPTFKLQGELVELRFMARAAALGLRVAKPWGDSAPYDFLVEYGGIVYRVQVKSTRFRAARCRGFVCVTRRGGKPYTPKEVDFIAAYVVPDDAWYIIPISAAGKEVSLNPRFRRNKYRRYREAWDLLIPERRNRSPHKRAGVARFGVHNRRYGRKPRRGR